MFAVIGGTMFAVIGGTMWPIFAQKKNCFVSECVLWVSFLIRNLLTNDWPNDGQELLRLRVQPETG